MSRRESALLGRMIFNVGARRSGTYWLQRMVTAHPLVAEVPSETHLFSHGIAPLLDRFQHDNPASPKVGFIYAERDQLLDAVRDLCDTVFAGFDAPGCERIAERTPLHAQHLKLIHEIYPDARYVHIIRDGRDVARSIAAQHWSEGTVALAAEEWRATVTAARYAGIPKDRYREVHYEALLANPRPILLSLFEFLDLPMSEDAMELVLAAALEKANVDLTRPDVGSDKWRSDFRADDLDTFNRVAGRLIRELGYPWAEPADLTSA